MQNLKDVSVLGSRCGFEQACCHSGAVIPPPEGCLLITAAGKGVPTRRSLARYHQPLSGAFVE